MLHLPGEAGETGRWCARGLPACRPGIPPQPARAGPHLHCAAGFRTSRRLARVLDSLVRVTRRVGWVADVAADPGRPSVARARPGGAARSGRTEHSPPRSGTAAPGAGGPVPRTGGPPSRLPAFPPSPRGSGGTGTGDGGRGGAARTKGDGCPPAPAPAPRPRRGLEARATRAAPRRARRPPPPPRPRAGTRGRRRRRRRRGRARARRGRPGRRSGAEVAFRGAAPSGGGRGGGPLPRPRDSATIGARRL